MWVYLGLVILILALWAYTHQKNLKYMRNNEIYQQISQNYRSYIIFCGIIFIFLIGCRADTVGIDTLNYKQTYIRMNYESFSMLSNTTWLQEPGYTALLIGLNKLGLSWNGFLIIAATIYVIPIMLLIYRESDNVFFSLLLFVLQGYFIFSMSTMRQSIAMGICILAFFQLKKKRYVRYFALTLFAALFHVSALISILLFVSVLLRINNRNIYIWTGIAFCVAIAGLTPLRELFISALSSLGKNYLVIETGGWFREIFFVITILLCLYINTFDKDFIEKHKISYIAILIAAVLLPIVKYHPALARLYFYFSIFEIILIPSIIARLRDLKIRLLGMLCYFIGGMYMLLQQLPTKSVIPYLFFWNS